jgi:protein O-GlcNAc transferase
MPAVTAPQGKPLDVARTFEQGLALHHQGRVVEAEALYSAVLTVRPDHFDALQMLGVIKLGRGDLAAALRLTGAALQQRPTSPQVLLNHGNVLDAMKRHDEALANFDEAIRRKKSFAEAHCNRGAALTALERYDEALESFKRAIALKPTTPTRSTTRAMRCGCSAATTKR